MFTFYLIYLFYYFYLSSDFEKIHGIFLSKYERYFKFFEIVQKMLFDYKLFFVF